MQTPQRSQPGGFDIRAQSGGTIHNVGGNQIHNITYAPPAPAATSVRGVARVLIGAGLLLSFAGLGAFGYVVVSFLVQIWSSFNEPLGSGPPDLDIPVIPWMPLGIGLAFAGMIVMVIGAAIPRRRDGGHRR